MCLVLFIVGVVSTVVERATSKKYKKNKVSRRAGVIFHRSENSEPQLLKPHLIVRVERDRLTMELVTQFKRENNLKPDRTVLDAIGCVGYSFRFCVEITMRKQHFPMLPQEQSK